MKKVLAFDFGASSGRAMLASFNGKEITMEEIHRFSNDPVSVNGTLYWDTLRLFFEIKQSISLAAQKGGFDAIGIDTWGVDFGLLDEQGKLIGNPVHYRDLRTGGIPEEVFTRLSQAEIYQRTGIQFMRINTLYQLAYLSSREPETLARAKKLLFTPDLFAYFLTGKMRAEVTIASTSNLYNPKLRNWDPDVLAVAGITEDLLPEIIQPGEVYGNLLPEICEELGVPSVPVIAVGTHDTASAVAAAPTVEKDFVYISCGTWSLFGTETEEPVINEMTEKANFTNEVGYNHSIRFLKNIMGLWLIQESRRQWGREGDKVGFDVLEKEALASEAFKSFINSDDPAFETPGNLPRRVREFCEKSGQPVPETRGDVMRCIYQSLAFKYKYTFEGLRSITGKDFRAIHIFGGGIKDTLLCQLTADACGVPVTAGPAEATVLGNIAAQLIALGEIEDLPTARKIIRNSVDLKIYEPKDTAPWNEHYEAFKKII